MTLSLLILTNCSQEPSPKEKIIGEWAFSVVPDKNIYNNQGVEEKKSSTTRYSDIRKEDGYAIAYKVEHEDDNGLISTITFSEVQKNPGVFDSAFAPPKD